MTSNVSFAAGNTKSLHEKPTPAYKPNVHAYSSWWLGCPHIASGGGRAGCPRPIGNCQKSSEIFDSKKNKNSNPDSAINPMSNAYSCHSVPQTTCNQLQEKEVLLLLSCLCKPCFPMRYPHNDAQLEVNIFTLIPN